LHMLELFLEWNENQINTIENFIDKYFPIRLQSQIGELMNQVFSGSKFAEPFAMAEKMMFENLH
jgi:hypothetical protein